MIEKKSNIIPGLNIAIHKEKQRVHELADALKNGLPNFNQFDSDIHRVLSITRKPKAILAAGMKKRPLKYYKPGPYYLLQNVVRTAARARLYEIKLIFTRKQFRLSR